MKNGVTTTLQGTGDTLVLPITTESMLALQSTGLDDACNIYVFGPEAIGEGDVAYDLSYCGHSTDVGMTATVGAMVPLVVFLRTDEPVEVSLGPVVP
jgi:hypothetical protein